MLRMRTPQTRPMLSDLVLESQSCRSRASRLSEERNRVLTSGAMIAMARRWRDVTVKHFNEVPFPRIDPQLPDRHGLVLTKRCCSVGFVQKDLHVRCSHWIVRFRAARWAKKCAATTRMRSSLAKIMLFFRCILVETITSSAGC
jgi:hypothetical protein